MNGERERGEEDREKQRETERKYIMKWKIKRGRGIEDYCKL